MINDHTCDHFVYTQLLCCVFYRNFLKILISDQMDLSCIRRWWFEAQVLWH